MAIHLALDDGPARLAAGATRDPEKNAAARAERIAMPAGRRPPRSVERVLRSGRSELWPGSDDDPVPGSLEHEEGIHSGVVVPPVARSRMLGTRSPVRGETSAPRRSARKRHVCSRPSATVCSSSTAPATSAPGTARRRWRPRPLSLPRTSSIASRIPSVAAGSISSRAESLPLDLGDRELWLPIHGVVVPDGIVYAFRDPTEDRALGTMRTEFVSTVSHELRTPLAAIYGAAMTLRQSDVALDETQHATLLDAVSGEADRLARTVNDILWASRLDTDALHVNIQACDPSRSRATSSTRSSPTSTRPTSSS